jgi:glyoxylase I family protein
MSTETRTQPSKSPFDSWVGHHAAIRVPDYEVSKSWFVETLGWRVTQEWMYGALQLAYIAPPADGSFHVEILGGPGVAAQIAYESVDDSLAELRRRGVTIVGEPFELEAIRSRLAFFADPFGNLFELKQSI